MSSRKRHSLRATFLSAMTDVMFSGIGIAAAFLVVFVLARRPNLAVSQPPVMLTLEVTGGVSTSGETVHPGLIGIGCLVVSPSGTLSSETGDATASGLSLQTGGASPAADSPAFRWARTQAVLEITAEPARAAHLLVFVVTCSKPPGTLDKVTVRVNTGVDQRDLTLDRNGGFAAVVPLRGVFLRERLPTPLPDWRSVDVLSRAGRWPLAQADWHHRIAISPDSVTGRYTSSLNIPDAFTYPNGVTLSSLQETHTTPIIAYFWVRNEPLYPSVIFTHSVPDVSAFSARYIKSLRNDRDPNAFRALLRLPPPANPASDAYGDHWLTETANALSSSFLRDVESRNVSESSQCESWRLISALPNALLAIREDTSPVLATRAIAAIESSTYGWQHFIDVAVDAACDDALVRSALGTLAQEAELTVANIAIGPRAVLIAQPDEHTVRVVQIPTAAPATSGDVLRLAHRSSWLVTPPSDDRMAPPWLFGKRSIMYLRPAAFTTKWSARNASDRGLRSQELLPLVVFDHETLARLCIRQDPMLWLTTP